MLNDLDLSLELNSQPAQAEDIDPTQAESVLPNFIEVGGVTAPEAPRSMEGTGIDVARLNELAIKLGNSVPSFTSQWAAEKLCLPIHLVDEIFWQLKDDHLAEILGQAGPFSYRYAVTQRGRELAKQLLEVSGYVGPAPVSVEAYSAMINWQSDHHDNVSFESVREVLSQLILPDSSVQVAALAAASGRSLFLFGPAGNGKTSLGRMLHGAIGGDLWIPHCIGVDNHVIRIFDAQCHQIADQELNESREIDRRWLRIRRPFIVAGGEMTINELDLAFSPSLRFYEAPPHVKANGGTFLIDDLGRQRVEPHELLNRWIVPLEHQEDHLTLNSGQKIQIPFRLMLIVATNLTVSDVADPAFLRRMGYRLHLDAPTPDQYAQIFRAYAAQHNVKVQPGVIERLLQRYQEEGRDLRASEPRDLVERSRDICHLYGRPFELTPDVLEIAWMGYFGNH
jgi:hypothetical protein